MMHHVNLPMMYRYRLAHEAFQCATHLDRLMVVEVNGVTTTRYEHFVGQNPMFVVEFFGDYNPELLFFNMSTGWVLRFVL